MKVRPPLAARRPRPKTRRRVASGVPRRQAAPGRSRWKWAGLLAAVIVGLAMLTRSCGEEAPPPPPPPLAAGGPKGGPAPPEPRPPPLPKPPPAKPPKPPDDWAPERKLLRDAIASRSGDLAACALPPGSPSRLLTRIRVARAGAVRGVVFANADPLPRGLSECLRGRMLAWSFADLALKADVEVLVTFDLGRGSPKAEPGEPGEPKLPGAQAP